MKDWNERTEERSRATLDCKGKVIWVVPPLTINANTGYYNGMTCVPCFHFCFLSVFRFLPLGLRFLHSSIYSALFPFPSVFNILSFVSSPVFYFPSYIFLLSCVFCLSPFLLLRSHYFAPHLQCTVLFILSLVLTHPPSEQGCLF